MAWPTELADWRRRVAEMYAAVRAAGGGAEAVGAFRAAKDALFAHHPQTPLPPAVRAGFAGLPYFPHDPAMRVTAHLEHEPDGPVLRIPTGAGESSCFRRVGVVAPVLAGTPVRLAVYWLEAYGGGLFLPFRDALAGAEVYGGGRYLIDTVKGADPGPAPDGALVLDFNLAYNPSCAYDPRWTCPLAPPENVLDIAIRAGERAPGGP